ncbi:MAG: hypothetical protein LBJ21_04735, partial [Acidobacteriota bacterium]|nr:hypothetical protein [Acidobacteriota bacterium]
MNSALKKFLFSAVMLNTTTLAMADQDSYETFGNSISRAFDKYVTVEVVSLLVIILILTVIGAILFEIRRSSKIKQELADLAAAKFDLQAEKMNLRPGNAVILKKIAQKAGLDDPGSILRFPQVFESSLDKYYESEKIESISNEMLVKISALRKTLGFSPLPRGLELTSTRQFCSGDGCTIQIPENDPQIYSGMCNVIDSEERYWS